MRQTIEAGEFQVLTEPRPLPPGLASFLADAEREWSENHNRHSAAEFVGASLVVGDRNRSADAAAYLKQIDDAPLLRSIGERALDASPTAGIGSAPERAQSESFEQHLHRALRQDRFRANQDPRNALAWASMARRYTMLGQIKQADRAMSIALALAPTSRYLHRVATRLFVHQSEPDRAYRLLKDFARTQRDPWLFAAFLAVANLAELPPTGLRKARQIVAGGDFRPIELSELASELGTMEMRSGLDRQARRLFNQSLEEPTGNSLAQAEWASRRLGSIRVEPSAMDTPFSAEAQALAATTDGKWPESLRYSEQWLDDQPFDSRAAVHGSFVASVALEQWTESIAICRTGLRANPRHPLLSNNLAFALIENGELDEAEHAIANVDLGKASDYDKTALMATTGLLAFRRGESKRGRALYERAIADAHALRNTRQEAMAEAMLLQESLRSNTGGEWLNPVMHAMRKLKAVVTDKAVLLYVDRLESRVGRVARNE